MAVRPSSGILPCVRASILVDAGPRAPARDPLTLGPESLNGGPPYRRVVGHQSRRLGQERDFAARPGAFKGPVPVDAGGTHPSRLQSHHRRLPPGVFRPGSGLVPPRPFEAPGRVEFVAENQVVGLPDCRGEFGLPSRSRFGGNPRMSRIHWGTRDPERVTSSQKRTGRTRNGLAVRLAVVPHALSCGLAPPRLPAPTLSTVTSGHPPVGTTG